MGKSYGLSNTEIEIMEFFWKRNDGLPFKDIFEIFNTQYEKNWKKQTLSTYLTQLQKAGLLIVDDTKRNYIYYTKTSREEHIHKWTQQLVKNSFNNSIGNFVAAFAGGSKLSMEEAQELKDLIESSWPSDDDELKF